ncbi:(2Fe-2S)-binding protein [Streptomyces sp. NPDC005955]|uniref:(2Fe-2S)-binding protein n=1 Tax=Streptomyces sp. NPDC005955 TaxID=3364738 RepID=UPI0036A4EB70
MDPGEPDAPVDPGHPGEATAPPAEVAAALRDVAELGGFFSVRVGGPDTGWHSLGEAYARGVPDLIAATTARHRSEEPRVAASITQLGQAARLWSPLLACTVLHGIVPDLSRLQRADEGPALRLPRATGRYAARVPRLVDELYDTVVTRRLDVLRAGLPVKVSPRLLDGNAASALVEAGRAVLAARPGVRGRLEPLVDRLLGTGRLTGTGSVTGPDLTFRRRSCCLYYRAPAGAKCGDCGLAEQQP